MGHENSKLTPENLTELSSQTAFSEEEIQLWWKSFLQVHPSGRVSKEGFKKIYSKIFPKGNAHLFAEHVFRTYDTNGDGMVDCREFICGFSATTRGSIDQKLEWNFALFDIDGDGFVSREEMLEIVKALYKMAAATQKSPEGELTPEEAAEKMFNQMDKNKDGKISLAEFTETAKRDPAIRRLLQWSAQ